MVGPALKIQSTSKHVKWASAAAPNPSVVPSKEECVPALLRALRPLYWTSLAFGLPPYRRCGSASITNLSRAYSVLWLSVILLLAYISMGEYSDMFVTGKLFASTISTVVREVVNHGAAACCLGTLLLSRDDRYVSAVRVAQYVDQLLNVDSAVEYRYVRKNVKVALCLAFSVALANMTSWGAINVVFLCDEVSEFISVLALLQFIILMLILRRKFRVVNSILTAFLSDYQVWDVNPNSDLFKKFGSFPMQLPEYSGDITFRPPDKIKASHLCCNGNYINSLRFAHLRLKLEAVSATGIYGVPIVAVVLQSLFAAIETIFTLSGHHISEHSLLPVALLLDLAGIFGRILGLSIVCQMTVSEAAHTGVLSEQLLLLVSAEGPLGREAGLLGQQVCGHGLALTACSLFRLDARLLTAFSAVVATYTVILLQFAVSEKAEPTAE